jgi:predicted N-acetyltransferase YhbS
MTIKQLNAAQIEEFIHSEDFKNSEVIPISTHRAISHIHNPRLKPDDKIMFLAYMDTKLVGYLGVLSDRIFVNDEEIHAGWLSSIWVDTKVRGKGIALNLLQTALNSWEGKILATEYTLSAKALYDKSNAFVELLELEGQRGYLRFNFHEILANKYSLFNKISPLLNLTDIALNAFNEIRLFFWKRRIRIDFNRIQYLNQIDIETSDFVSLKQKKELTRRGIEELNWIIKYPWILNTSNGDSSSHKYHFSSFDESFENITLKMTNKDGNIIAFLMFVFRSKHLKIPYCYFEEEKIEEVINIIFYHMLEKKIKMVTVFNPDLITYFKTRKTPFFHLRKMKRGYIITKKIFESFNASKTQVHIHNGDGDCAFT